MKESKKAQKRKVNSTPHVVESSQHVTLADSEAINKELKAVTSIQKRGKHLCFKHSITHKI